MKEIICLTNYYQQQDKKQSKLRNAFENNMSIDIKLYKTQIIQSGGLWGSLLSKIVGPLTKVAVP